MRKAKHKNVHLGLVECLKWYMVCLARVRPLVQNLLPPHPAPPKVECSAFEEGWMKKHGRTGSGYWECSGRKGADGHQMSFSLI
jgi:hypothetical protein